MVHSSQGAAYLATGGDRRNDPSSAREIKVMRGRYYGKMRVSHTQLGPGVLNPEPHIAGFFWCPPGSSCMLLLRTVLSLSLFLFIANTFSNAQNLMTRRYSIASNGELNRGDFNEDGIPDVVFQTSAGVAVALGTPQGTLGAIKSSNASYTSNGEMLGLAVGRFTSSGHLDVAVSYRSSCGNGCSIDATDILLGRGDGTFSIGTLNFGGAGSSLTSGDFNGDGKTDLAVIDAGARIFIFTRSGDGTFNSIALMETDLDCCFQGYQLRVGDFDADGRPDLAVRDSNRLLVLFNNGNLVFEPKVVIPNSGRSLNALAPQDVNQDGSTDILLSLFGEGPPDGPYPTGLSVYTSTGRTRGFTRTFYRDPDIELDSSFDIAAVDVDGDGIKDIVGLAPTVTKGIYFFRGLPNGGFSSTPVSFAIGGLGVLGRFVSLDINRDGRPDFVTLTSDNGKAVTSLNAIPRAACANSTRSPSVTACQPTDSVYLRSPARVVARTTDTAAPVTRVQVYRDNNLVTSVAGGSIDTQVPLSVGAHSIVVKAWDATGRTFLTRRLVDAYSGTPGRVCSNTVPNTVNICAPAQNAGASSPVRVLAAARNNLPVTSIQVYVDNQLVFRDDSANYVDRTFALGPGQHRIVVKTFDTGGRQFSQARNITVQ